MRLTILVIHMRCLPGNKTGWLRGSGIIHVGLGEMIPVTNAEDFASTALRLKGQLSFEWYER